MKNKPQKSKVVPYNNELNKGVDYSKYAHKYLFERKGLICLLLIIREDFNDAMNDMRRKMRKLHNDEKNFQSPFETTTFDLSKLLTTVINDTSKRDTAIECNKCLSDITDQDVTTLAYGLSFYIGKNRSATSALTQWEDKYPAIQELAQENWFKSLLVPIVVCIRRDKDLVTYWRMIIFLLLVGVSESRFDC